MHTVIIASSLSFLIIVLYKFLGIFLNFLEKEKNEISSAIKESEDLKKQAQDKLLIMSNRYEKLENEIQEITESIKLNIEKTLSEQNHKIREEIEIREHNITQKIINLEKNIFLKIKEIFLTNIIQDIEHLKKIDNANVVENFLTLDLSKKK